MPLEIGFLISFCFDLQCAGGSCNLYKQAALSSGLFWLAVLPTQAKPLKPHLVPGASLQYWPVQPIARSMSLLLAHGEQLPC